MPSIIFIGGSIPVAITATAFSISTTATSCATLAMSLGSADANRYNYMMLVRYNDSVPSLITGVSVGGVACESVASLSSLFSYQQALWKVNSGNGTVLSTYATANFVLTVGAGTAQCAVAMYQVIGGTNNSSTTTAASTDAEISFALSLPAGSGTLSSFIYAAALFPGAPAVTWANMTKDYDQNFAASGSNQDYSTANRVDATAASVTISASGVGGTTSFTQLFATVLS